MKRHHRRLALLVIAVLALSGTPPAQAAIFNITLFASPQTIRADGRSTAQISAQVRDASGTPVPDGTEVNFATTAGSITPVVRTQGGVAVAMLTAAATPAIAVVSAALGASSNGTQVEFVAAEGGDVRASRTIKIDADSLYYSADQNRAFAVGKARLDYHGLLISAEAIQYDLAQDIVKAQDGVTFTRGKKSLEGEDIVYYPSSNRGSMIRIGESIETFTFQGDSLETTPAKFAIGSEELAAFKPEESRMAVEARRMVLFPGERIQFTHAKVLVNGAAMITLPNYIVSLAGYTGNMLEQQIRYTTSEGMVLDLPIYFGVTENRSSALKLRYASSGSNYSDQYQPRRGFSLGFQQNYSLGVGGQGQLMMDSLLQKDRRFDLTHRQEFSGGARADLSLGYQPVSVFARNVLYGYASYSKPLGRYNLSLTASDNTGTTESGPYRNPTFRAGLQSLERRVGKLPLNFSTNLNVGYGRIYTANALATLTGGEFGTYENLGVSLRPNSWKLAKKTSVTSNVRAEHTLFNNGLQGSRAGADLTLQQSLGRTTGLRLGYSYSLQSGSLGYYSPSTHLVTMGLFASKARFNSDLSLNYGFGRNRSMIAYANAGYRLAPTWRVFFRSNLSQSWLPVDQVIPSQHFQYNYSQFGVGKSFGNYEVSVNWSPEGRQAYGAGGSAAKLWLEMGTSAW